MNPPQLPPIVEQLRDLKIPFSLKVIEREYSIDVSCAGKLRTTNVSQNQQASFIVNKNGKIRPSLTKEVPAESAKKSTTKKRSAEERKAIEPSTSQGFSGSMTSKKLRPNQYSNCMKQFETQPELLTLDEMSCGSSCSTVTSDDEKNFRPFKFQHLRTVKQKQHKQEKLRRLSTQTCPDFISTDPAPDKILNQKLEQPKVKTAKKQSKIQSTKKVFSMLTRQHTKANKCIVTRKMKQ